MSTVPTWSLAQLQDVIARHWGHRHFRPLQKEAMTAALDGRDSLVVLPTGGGKSLCYQAPALVRGDTTVVVSPLIALMKDQVDRLQAMGVAAVALNSSQADDERQQSWRAVSRGQVRLVFASPERLTVPSFIQMLQRINVGSFAIDEAHCISQWGHDFRPEYRQLKRLRELFPNVSLHAFTATASPRVRQDIIEQVHLHEPAVLVGDFDRPNLLYRVEWRSADTELKQICAALDRWSTGAGIVYCITRKQVDELTEDLKREGFQPRAYHAGMTDPERKQAQDAFMNGKCDLVVATVAFGMGIDRPDIRVVVHRGMPRSLDHYQQEAGRAGRDGQEAECVLLYNDRDVRLWEWMMKQQEGELSAEVKVIAEQQLDAMARFCRGRLCRHRALVEHFGQKYPGGSCAGCDICLEHARARPDGTELAQKILSCVARVLRDVKGRPEVPAEQVLTVRHIIDLMLGRTTPLVQQARHDGLSTFGLLSEFKEGWLRAWLGQLLAQGALKESGDPAVLHWTDAGTEVLRSQRAVRLTEPATPTKRASVPTVPPTRQRKPRRRREK